MSEAISPERAFKRARHGGVRDRPDIDRASQVAVTFEPQAEGGTRVTLEHRGFESYGEPGGEMRAAVGGKEAGRC